MDWMTLHQVHSEPSREERKGGPGVALVRNTESMWVEKSPRSKVRMLDTSAESDEQNDRQNDVIKKSYQ